MQAKLETRLADRAGKFGVVHIVSHFHFQPTGDETRSFLIYQTEPGLGKAECLRRAQLALLRGEVALDPKALRGLTPGNSAPTGLPAFVAPAKAPAAHPFYWAPFILMGNTR